MSLRPGWSSPTSCTCSPSTSVCGESLICEANPDVQRAVGGVNSEPHGLVGLLWMPLGHCFCSPNQRRQRVHFFPSESFRLGATYSVAFRRKCSCIHRSEARLLASSSESCCGIGFPAMDGGGCLGGFAFRRCIAASRCVALRPGKVAK